MQTLRYACLLALFFFQLANPPLFSANLWASTLAQNPLNPFQDDLSQIDCEMSELESLALLVEQTNATYAQLVQQEAPLARHILPGGDIGESLFGSSAPDRERLIGIPGFLWGFCCSVVGMFLVYIAIDDPASKKKEGVQAIYGCAVGTLLWVGAYIWLVFWVSYY